MLGTCRVSSAVCHLLSAALQVVLINSSATAAWVTVSDPQLLKTQPRGKQHMLRRTLRRKGARWQGQKKYIGDVEINGCRRLVREWKQKYLWATKLKRHTQRELAGKTTRNVRHWESGERLRYRAWSARVCLCASARACGAGALGSLLGEQEHTGPVCEPVFGCSTGECAAGAETPANLLAGAAEGVAVGWFAVG